MPATAHQWATSLDHPGLFTGKKNLKSAIFSMPILSIYPRLLNDVARRVAGQVHCFNSEGGPMGLSVNTMVTTIRNERLQVAGYQRTRIRNDKDLSVSAIGNGLDTPAGQTLAKSISIDHGAVSTMIFDIKDPLAMWGKIRTALSGLHGRLDDMRDLVAEVAAGGIVTLAVDIKQSLFEAIRAEVNAMLAGVEHHGNQLLTSSDAVVSIDLSILDLIDLEDAADIAVVLVDAAIEDIKQADETAVAKLAKLNGELEGLQAWAESIDNQESYLVTVDEAQSAMQSLLAQLTSGLMKAMTPVQANVDPDRAVALLGDVDNSEEPAATSAGASVETTNEKLT